MNKYIIHFMPIFCKVVSFRACSIIQEFLYKILLLCRKELHQFHGFSTRRYDLIQRLKTITFNIRIADKYQKVTINCTVCRQYFLRYTQYVTKQEIEINQITKISYDIYKCNKRNNKENILLTRQIGKDLRPNKPYCTVR